MFSRLHTNLANAFVKGAYAFTAVKTEAILTSRREAVNLVAAGGLVRHHLDLLVDPDSHTMWGDFTALQHVIEGRTARRMPDIRPRVSAIGSSLAGVDREKFTIAVKNADQAMRGLYGPRVFEVRISIRDLNIPVKEKLARLARYLIRAMTVLGYERDRLDIAATDFIDLIHEQTGLSIEEIEIQLLSLSRITIRSLYQQFRPLDQQIRDLLIEIRIDEADWVYISHALRAAFFDH